VVVKSLCSTERIALHTRAGWIRLRWLLGRCWHEADDPNAGKPGVLTVGLCFMRISGGECKGRRLRVPKSGLRPTQDQVREALFSMLADFVPGAHFLDLFAGSGAVGLEALSRGASRATWVESHAPTVKVIKENLAELALDGGFALRGDALRVDLAGLPGAPFDVIFADPPYAEVRRDENGAFLVDPVVGQLVDRVVDGNALKPEGFLVIEQAKRGAVLSRPGWALLRDRTYGTARILIYQRSDSGA
jgi:16S rRNA (guanine966-N2)-methyltransferase